MSVRCACACISAHVCACHEGRLQVRRARVCVCARVLGICCEHASCAVSICEHGYLWACALVRRACLRTCVGRRVRELQRIASWVAGQCAARTGCRNSARRQLDIALILPLPAQFTLLFQFTLVFHFPLVADRHGQALPGCDEPAAGAGGRAARARHVSGLGRGESHC